MEKRVVRIAIDAMRLALAGRMPINIVAIAGVILLKDLEQYVLLSVPRRAVSFIPRELVAPKERRRRIQELNAHTRPFRLMRHFFQIPP